VITAPGAAPSRPVTISSPTVKALQVAIAFGLLLALTRVAGYAILTKVSYERSMLKTQLRNAATLQEMYRSEIVQRTKQADYEAWAVAHGMVKSTLPTVTVGEAEVGGR
jgi:hypothetical protein